MRHKDGRWVWVLDRGKVSEWDSDGRPRRMTGTALDVSERKEAEEALRESEEKFRTVADFTYDWEAWRTPDGAYRYVSPSCERISGHAAAEFMADPDLTVQITHPDDRSKVIAHQDAVGHEAQDQALELDYRILTPSGETRSISHSCTPVYGKDGQWLGRRESNRDVSARKQAEDALRESEARYRTLFDSASDGITVMDAQGRFVDANPTACRMTGFTREELLAQSISERLVAEEIPRLMPLLERVIAGEASEGEWRLLRKDGGSLFCDVAVTLLPDGRLLGIARDIGERKRAEEALRQATDRLSLAARAGGVGVWDYDPVNDTLTWDEQMFALYGVTRERFGGAYEAWQAGLHPDDRQRGDAEIKAAMRGEKELDTEFRVLWPDGTIRDIRALALVQRDASGRATHVIGTNWDITAQKRLEEALRSSEANFRALFEAVDDIIVVATPDARIVYANPAASHKLGYSVDELSAMHALDVYPAGERGEAVGIFAAVLTGERESCSLALQSKSGALIPAETRAWFCQWGGAECIFGVSKDRTREQEALLYAQAQAELEERRQAEEVLARSSAQLREQLHDTVKTMGAIVSLRDPYTAAHERRVTELATAIAVELGLSEEAREGLAFAGEVHDVGKVGVPAEILSKPAALTDMELALIKQHPQAGRELLAAIRFRQPVAEIVGQHHERLDGSGYPDGLKGDEIVFEARILAVADVVEAMASHRPYRAGLGLEAALAEVRAGAGVRYDDAVVAACERVFAQGFVFTEA